MLQTWSLTSSKCICWEYADKNLGYLLYYAICLFWIRLNSLLPQFPGQQYISGMCRYYTVFQTSSRTKVYNIRKADFIS